MKQAIVHFGTAAHVVCAPCNETLPSSVPGAAAEFWVLDPSGLVWSAWRENCFWSDSLETGASENKVLNLFSKMNHFAPKSQVHRKNSNTEVFPKWRNMTRNLKKGGLFFFFLTWFYSCLEIKGYVKNEKWQQRRRSQLIWPFTNKQRSKQRTHKTVLI